MDIIAHGLWAGLGAVWLGRRRPVGRAQVAAAAALGVLPDVVHLAPVAAWAIFGGGTAADFVAYALAAPGGEPAMPAWTAAAAHHLHCTFHSGLVAAAVALLVARVPRWWRALAVPLAGWWLHIGIDVFTHSADFYPAPVLYPITQQGFDGIAWNTPWFLAANYAALALAAVLLWRGRRR
jgi:hypothetical protein